ncbi:oligosaccharide flippase family protein [uncultured Draconibacterium sp.]|uniref:lipopolysaccharide biosynthesis protein n=1 Tax=uncultured Draconibacterium sp. TaxID=1573823 RepID=UPI0029C69CDB|nr:oligosaccharide flippase family protein [uncultured Draconibacterium sp.]
MGIIIKQSLRGSIWSYLGLIVGYINVGIIMPNFFQPEQIGLTQIFLAISTIFSNFSSLGFGGVINRMFPEFRNKDKSHNGFLFVLLATGLTGFILSTVAFFILKPSIVEGNMEKSPLLVEYIFLLVPLIFFRILFRLLDNYNRVLYDAVTGAFWNEFVHKTINLALIILFSFELIEFRDFFYGYVISLSLPVFPIIIVLIRRGEFNVKPQLNFLTRPLVREMALVSTFGIINGLSGVLTNNIDKLLINKYLSLEYVGIFSVCALFASILFVPSRSTVKIAVGIIAQAWKDNNTDKIQEIYKKASLTQTIIGTLIFAGILVNLNSIFTILPERYALGKWVLIIYSFGMLIRVSNTTGGNIISTSKYYRVMALIIASQIIYTVLFHTTFIPMWGITGAAIAVLMTYFVRSLIVVTYLKVKMGFFCYSYKHLLVLIFAAVSVLLARLIPDSKYLVLNILIKSGTVTILYTSVIVGLNVSDEITELYRKGITLILSKFK